MTNVEFEQWVAMHVLATGGDAVRISELLWANRETIVSRWHATYLEICECSDRLVERGAVPDFPDKHTNALHRELLAIRDLKARENKTRQFRAVHANRVDGCDCPACNSGEILPSYEAAMARYREFTATFGKMPERRGC